MASRKEIESWKGGPWDKLPSWGKAAVIAFGILVVVAMAAIGNDDSGDDPEPARATPSRPAQEPASSTRPAAHSQQAPQAEAELQPVEVSQKLSPQQQVREALGDSVSSDLA